MGAKQAGYTDQQIQQYLASKSQVAPTTQSAPEPQQQGGGLADLLPLIGAVGGSFTPLGPIGGGIIGAGLGTLGKQLLRGKTDPAEIVKEGALAGAGGVGGKLIGGLLGKVLPGALERVGQGAISSQYNVPRNVARAIKFPESIKTLANKYGLTSMEAVTPAAEQVTGANGIISQLTRRAVAKANPVELGGYQTAQGTTPSVAEIAQNLVGNPSITPATETKFINFIQKGISQSMGGEAGNITGTVNPSEVFGFIQQLEKQAQGLLRGRAPTAITAEDKALANAYNSVADELRHRLFNISGADQALTGGLLKPTEIQALAKINPKLAQEVTGAKTVGELRSLAAPFVQANQAAAETQAASQYGLQNMAGQAKGIASVIPTLANPLAPIGAIAGMPQVNAAVGGAALKGANALRSIPLPATNTLEKLGVGAATGLGGTTGEAQATGLPQLPQMDNQILPDVSKNPMQEKLRQLFFLSMMSNPKNATTLKTIFDFGFPKPPAVTADRAASLQSGIGAVDKSLKSVGGYGPLTGRAYEVGLKVAGGTGVPDEAIRLETQYNLLRQNIVRAFQGARMSDQDMKIALSYTPSLADTPRTAKLKLQTLKEMLSGLQTELRNSPGTESGSDIPMPNNIGL